MTISFNDIGKTVGFSVYAPGVIKGDFTTVKLIAILDADTANREINITQLHADVYSSLPVGSTIDSATAYNYLKVKFANGGTAIVGIPWINQASYHLIPDTGVTNIQLANTSPDDQIRLRNILLQNNFQIIALGY